MRLQAVNEEAGQQTGSGRGILTLRGHGTPSPGPLRVVLGRVVLDVGWQKSIRPPADIVVADESGIQ